MSLIPDWMVEPINNAFPKNVCLVGVTLEDLREYIVSHVKRATKTKVTANVTYDKLYKFCVGCRQDSTMTYDSKFKFYYLTELGLLKGKDVNIDEFK